MESGHRILNSAVDAERIGIKTPLAHTLAPATSRELPEASEAVAPLASHLPSMAAIAPGLHAATRERLAAFTTPETTGSPESTCTVTDALALEPEESTTVKSMP